MTERGTFIINGAERVVVSQLHRSPGVSFNKEINIQTGKDLFSGKIIPYKGTWLEFETDKNDFLSVKIDRKKKVLATVFLKAIDFFDNNTEIKDYFLETKELDLASIFQKYKNREELLSVIRTRFEGSFIKEDINNTEIKDYFLETKELDLASIFQKYKNREELLSVIRTRFEGSFIKEDIYDEETGEVIAEADALIDEALIESLIDNKVEKVVYWEVKPEDKLLANTVMNDSTLTKEEAVTEVFKKLRPGDLVTVESAKSLVRQMFIDEALIESLIDNKVEKVVYWEVKPEDKLLANTVMNDSTLTKEEAVTAEFKKLRPGDLVTVESAKSLIRQMFFNPQRYDLEPVGRYKMNKRLKLNVTEDEILLTKEDIIATMKYVINLNNGNGHTDDIDNLSNRRVRGVGELLLMQIKAGLSKMGKMVKEKMTVQECK